MGNHIVKLECATQRGVDDVLTLDTGLETGQLAREPLQSGGVARHAGDPRTELDLVHDPSIGPLAADLEASGASAGKQEQRHHPPSRVAASHHVDHTALAVAS